jgi:hypothetical protein
MISHFIDPFLIPFVLAGASTLLLLAFADVVRLFATIAMLRHPVMMTKQTSVAGSSARSHRTQSKRLPAHSTMQAPMVNTCTN